VNLSLVKIAIYEMIYAKLPYKVAINEVVELAKKYSDEQDKAFVNGILASIVKKENPSKVIIVCGEISPDTINFANNFDMQILLLDKYSSYKALYKEFDFFPEISFEYKKDKARTFKEIIKFAFSKDKAKGYLLSAFVLLLSSFFVRINLYYCIVSSILLVFALICYSTKSDEMPNEVL